MKKYRTLSRDNPLAKKKTTNFGNVERSCIFFLPVFDLLRCSTESKNMRVEPCGYDGCDTSRITQLHQKFFGLIMMILKSKTQ